MRHPAEQLPFRVCYCESADARAPARNLEQQAAPEAQSIGWRSADAPRCPIEIGLQFEGRVAVRSVSLTSHQHLIPSCVELLCGSVVQRSSAASSNATHTQADYATATFQRLGFTRLDTNERSGYRAREVKTVHVDATGHFLKLLIHEAHANPLNPQRQVSLVQVRVEGTQELSKGFSAPGLVPGMLAPTDHLAFTHDAGLDVHFMQVGLDPSAAVAPIGLMPLAPFEPPSTAESDQSCVDVPASVVSPEKPAEQPRRPHAPFFERAIEQLVAEKAAAVGCEDYDRANTVKAALAEVSSYAEQVEAAESAKDDCVQSEDFDGANRLKAQVEQLVGRTHSVLEQLRASAGQPRAPAPAPAPPPVPALRPPAPAPEPAPMPAMAMAPSAQPQPQPSPRAQPQPQERVASPLDEAARAEHAQAIELFGLYTVQCLRSSHAELRQAGLGQVAQNIADERLPRLEPAVLHEAAVGTTLPTLRDERDEGVLEAAVEVLRLTMATHGGRVPSAALQSSTMPAIELLLGRATDSDRAHTTERGSIAAQRGCLQLALAQHPEGAFLAEALAKTVESATLGAGKGAAAVSAVPRLQILRDLTPRLHGRPGGDGGAAAVLPAVTLALTSDEAAVRSAAVETAAACYRRLGRARVESVLLEDEGLKPALRQVLGMTFRGIDTEGVAR